MELETVEDVYGQYFGTANVNDASSENEDKKSESSKESSECSMLGEEASTSPDGESDDDINLIEPDESIPVDNADGDDADIRKVFEFCCDCTQANQHNPCSMQFSPEELLEMRQEAKSLDYYDQDHCNRLDIVILGQLRALCRSSVMTKRSHQSSTFRKRTRTTYQLKGHVVCKKTFFFAYGISKMRFQRLLAIYYEEGMCEKPHGSTKNRNSIRTPEATVKRVVQFIRNYAIQHALFLPSRMAAHRDVAVKLLPSGETKKHVYNVYCKVCQDNVSQIVPLSTFRKLWSTFCPEIVFQKPMTDLCDFCQKNFVSMHQLAGKTHEEKQEQVDALNAHLRKVEEERKYYNEIIEETKRDPEASSVHFSFDMAQRIFLPSNPLQPSSIYFLVPFRVGIFGVMCDTFGRQINYLLPESIDISKGSNTVVNLLSHGLSKGYETIRKLTMHADNCIGQNKNNLVLFFLNFLILTGAFVRVELNFMVKGHTKFSCDRCFGLLKKKYRSCICNTLNDLVEMIEMSTPESRTNTAALVGNESGDLLIDMFDWTTFFANERWKKIPLITSYSHFVFSSDDPGAVHCRVDLNSTPKRFEVGKLSSPTAYPQPLSVTRFSHERQEYLFKEIRQFCSPEAADILCPKPTYVPPQPDSERAVPLPETSIPQPKRRRPRKVDANEPENEEDVDDPEYPLPKPKRGRPRKIDANEPVNEEDVHNLEYPLPKPKRGRPRKNVPTNDEVLKKPKEMDVIPKRPRGRPRKKPAPVVKASAVSVENLPE